MLQSTVPVLGFRVWGFGFRVNLIGFVLGFTMWRFPKIKGIILRVPIINKDYSILGSILGPLVLGNYHLEFRVLGLRILGMPGGSGDLVNRL